MAQFPIFLSVVMGARNQSQQLETLLAQVSATISPLVDDYELIVIENGSTDQSVAVLAELTRASGLPNLQVYALTRSVDSDTLASVGLEHALGDFVAIVDPLFDDVGYLQTMLECAAKGADIVYAVNTARQPESVAYRLFRGAFNNLYKALNGAHLAKEGSRYRLLSKRVVNFILQHSQPALSYRQLPATGGFARVNLSYECAPRTTRRKRLASSIDPSLRLLVSTSRLPMRLVTTASSTVSLVALITASWALAWACGDKHRNRLAAFALWQQAVTHFAATVVQLFLGEYLLHLASVSGGAPPYHVAAEYTSAVITRRQRLNIEVADSGIARSMSEVSATRVPPAS